jgi:hypothetical protein
MTDKELLEWAAKAIGCEIGLSTSVGVQLIENGMPVKWWNPLTDDGDALRLAVKLGINPNFTANHCFIDDAVYCEEAYGDNPYAATRRAIVRAAAEIGKSMP